MKRIMIANSVALNGGDAAILLAIRSHLDAAFGQDIDVVVADSHREAAAIRHPGQRFVAPLAAALLRYPRTRWIGRLIRDLNVGRWLLAAHLHRRAPWASRLLLRRNERRKLEQYAQLDLAVSTGGTYLVEAYSPWPRLTEMRVLIALGVPLVLYTQSLGPFTTPRLVRGVRAVAAGAQLVLLRDEKSLRHLEQIGADVSRARVVADAVFTFARPHPASPPAPAPSRVAFSVRSWPHARDGAQAERYRTAVRHLVEHLTQEGAEVTFLSTCQGVAGYVDDSVEAQAIVDGLDPEVRRQVTVDSAYHDPFELLEALEGFDAVISTRMHFAILALCAGRPVLPIAYEFKTRELFARLGLGEHVRDFEGLDPDDLVEAWSGLQAAGGGWTAEVARAVERERHRADEPVALLRMLR